MNQVLKRKPIAEMNRDESRAKQILSAIRKHGQKPNALIEILHLTQDLFGYLPLDAMSMIAKELKVSPSRVYGVATFYHLFRLKPQGKHNCLICTGTACHVKGSQKLLDEVKKVFGIEQGQTTPDGELSVQGARCLGCCSLAPAVVLDGKILAKVQPGDLIKDIKKAMGVAS